MSVTEAVIAASFALLGLRSLGWWARRPFESNDVRDHLLYAAYLTGRVGMWFAIAGLFLLLSLAGGARSPGDLAGGNGLAGFASRYGWYAMVFLVLGISQVVAGFFLGRRAPRTRRRGPNGEDPFGSSGPLSPRP